MSDIVKYTMGNTKLGAAIMNLSLTPIITCHPKVPCKSMCYALRAYNRWPSVKKAWDHNTMLWMNNPGAFEDSLKKAIDKENPNRFRWHVGGDIPDQRYLDMIYGTAMLFPATRFLVFTKRYDLNYNH